MKESLLRSVDLIRKDSSILDVMTELANLFTDLKMHPRVKLAVHSGLGIAMSSGTRRPLTGLKKAIGGLTLGEWSRRRDP